MTHLVLPFHRMEEAAPYLDPKRLHYLHEGQSESFESFEDFDLLAFDWYDIHSDRTETAKILVYVTQEALFSSVKASRRRPVSRDSGGDCGAGGRRPPGGTGAVPVFSAPAEGDMDYLDRFEGEVNEAEAHILSGTQATKRMSSTGSSLGGGSCSG